MEVCRSKRKTYLALAQYAFVPKVYEHPSEIEAYPVFLKPAVGQGSEGANVLMCANSCKSELMVDPGNIICEYLSGDEYTVDCFFDRHGCLLAALPRVRERIKMGISVRPDDTLYNGISGNC